MLKSFIILVSILGGIIFLIIFLYRHSNKKFFSTLLNIFLMSSFIVVLLGFFYYSIEIFLIISKRPPLVELLKKRTCTSIEECPDYPYGPYTCYADSEFVNFYSRYFLSPLDKPIITFDNFDYRYFFSLDKPTFTEPTFTEEQIKKIKKEAEKIKTKNGFIVGKCENLMYFDKKVVFLSLL